MASRGALEEVPQAPAPKHRSSIAATASMSRRKGVGKWVFPAACGIHELPVAPPLGASHAKKHTFSLMD